LENISKDIIILEWGYEYFHPFDKRGEVLKNAGFDFYVCPGTSGWSSFTGRTDNMLGNIENAVKSGKEHGAKGMLLTDWGDGGHVNYTGVSYASYCYAAGQAWNVGSVSEKELVEFLNQFVFKDKNGEMGQFVLDAGRYNNLEEFPVFNSTLSNMIVSYGYWPKALLNMVMSKLDEILAPFLDEDSLKKLKEIYENRREFDGETLLSYLSKLYASLDKTHLTCNHAEIIKDEFKNNLRMVELGVRVRHLIETEDDVSPDEQEQMKEFLLKLLSVIQDEHKRLWAIRNKPGGLLRSLTRFVNLEESLEG